MSHLSPSVHPDEEYDGFGDGRSGEPRSFFIQKMRVDEELRVCVMEVKSGGVWLAEVLEGGAFHRAGVTRGFLSVVADFEVADLAGVAAALESLRREGVTEYEVVVTPLVDPNGEPGAMDWPLAENPLYYQIVKEHEGEPLGLCAMGLPAGIWIGDVVENSACWRAGVPQGLLVSINGEPLTDTYELEDFINVLHAEGVFEFELEVYPHVPPEQRRERRGLPHPRHHPIYNQDVVVFSDEPAARASCGLPLGATPLTFTVPKFTSTEDLRYCAFELVQGGVWLAEILPGGPLDRAGVCRGLLLSVDGVPVRDIAELRRAMQRLFRAEFKMCVVPTYAEEQRRLAAEDPHLGNTPLIRPLMSEPVLTGVTTQHPGEAGRFKAMASPAMPDSGVRLTHLEPRGLFARHNVPLGRLVHIDGKEIYSIADLEDVMRDIKATKKREYQVAVLPYHITKEDMPKLVGPRAQKHMQQGGGAAAGGMIDRDGLVKSPIPVLTKIPQSPMGAQAPIPTLTRGFPPRVVAGTRGGAGGLASPLSSSTLRGTPLRAPTSPGIEPRTPLGIPGSPVGASRARPAHSHTQIDKNALATRNFV